MFEAFDDYYKCYYPKDDLDYEQFNDVFSAVINNTQVVFSKLENCGYVDIYEAFVALTVFSFGDFDVKLLGLFRSFDTDNGGTIDKQEFLKFLQSAIQGLCKLLKLPIPT